jgi:hypothetical protein
LTTRPYDVSKLRQWVPINFLVLALWTTSLAAVYASNGDFVRAVPTGIVAAGTSLSVLIRLLPGGAYAHTKVG